MASPDKSESAAIEKRSATLKLTGPQKGCIFLISLDEAVATRILSHLSEDEVRLLRKTAETLKELEPGALAFVYREFSEKLQQGVPTVLKGSGPYLRRLVGKALGEGVASDVWSEGKKPINPGKAFENPDIPTILGIIEREHDQTVAVILSQLSPAQSSDILGRLPVERQAQILRRLAQLQSVPAAVIEEIEKQFASEMETVGDVQLRETDGQKSAVGLLKRMDPEKSDALIKELGEIDGVLADQLRPLLFTFEDLLRIDSRGMQLLLREVSREQLVVALKTASDEIKEKVFGSLSSRAAEVLRDELEMLGPVRVSDVEKAQGALVDKALELERENRITIAREGKADYV
jgi:flagellar motor switch protein FliG